MSRQCIFCLEPQQVHGTGRRANRLVVTQSEVRIFKPAAAKGASKSFDDALCDAAAVAQFETQGFALVTVFGDRTTRAYSLPALKEIGRAPLNMLDPTRTTSAIVSKTGDVFGWTGPSELAILPVWGSGRGWRIPWTDLSTRILQYLRDRPSRTSNGSVVYSTLAQSTSMS